MNMTEANQSGTTPTWFANNRINEVEFCKDFLKKHDIACLDGKFYTTEGLVQDTRNLRRDILKAIQPYITSNVGRRVEQLLALMRLMDYGTVCTKGDTLHVKNGTYVLGQGVSPFKQYCAHRFLANYDPDRKIPKIWTDFLNDLLEEGDIYTLQEFMGYCLIPTTRAQKMLIITGRGGEGKSRIAVVMKAIFGDAMSVGSLAKLETNRFARADLEGKLVMVDDDLQMSALPDTNYIKSIVTADIPMDLERKGEQSYQGMLYSRLIAFGNDTLQALHDRSYGFFRRQIILTAKPVRPDREDDPFLGHKLCQEIDGIFTWCVEGLIRLAINNFQFTITDSAEKNLKNAIRNSNNITEFMESKGYFSYDQNATVSSRRFYFVYKEWCDDNNLTALSPKTFWTFLSQNAEKYGLRYDKNVSIGDGRLVRGFHGIRLELRYR